MEPGAVTAGDIWSMVKRRIVLIVALFLVFTAATVGGFGLWWVKYPGYRSVALIEKARGDSRAFFSCVDTARDQP